MVWGKSRAVKNQSTFLSGLEFLGTRKMGLRQSSRFMSSISTEHSMESIAARSTVSLSGEGSRLIKAEVAVHIIFKLAGSKRDSNRKFVICTFSSRVVVAIWIVHEATDLWGGAWAIRRCSYWSHRPSPGTHHALVVQTRTSGQERRRDTALFIVESFRQLLPMNPLMEESSLYGDRLHNGELSMCAATMAGGKKTAAGSTS